MKDHAEAAKGLGPVPIEWYRDLLADRDRWKEEAIAARDAFKFHDGYHRPAGPCPHCISADRWRAARAANGATP